MVESDKALKNNVGLSHVGLSQEIADGVNKSAQAVQAAEAGIRQIGSLARHQTMCMFTLSCLLVYLTAIIILFLYQNGL